MFIENYLTEVGLLLATTQVKIRADLFQRLTRMTSSNEPVKRVEENHPFYTALLYGTTYLFPVFAAYAFYLAGQTLIAESWAWTLAPLFLVGLLGSDLVSGLAHWFFDNYGSPETPLFGQTIELFRVHHDLPKDICNSNFVFTCGHVCLWAVPLYSVGIGTHFVVQGTAAAALVAAGEFIFATGLLFLVLTNQFHKWAHLDERPAWLEFLQQKRFVLEPNHHNVHHTPPYESYYCITTGWLNPFLFKIDFFTRMEKFLAAIGIQKSIEVQAVAQERKV